MDRLLNLYPEAKLLGLTATNIRYLDNQRYMVDELFLESPEVREKCDEFRKDKNAHLKLLCSIDMLNEGIHVDDVADIILFRPMISPILYKQQVCRALSAAEKNTPVILDVVNNYDNLYSISSLRQEIEVIVNSYKGEQRDDLIV